MAVKIRLKRMGKIRAPFYRVVIMDSRAKRDGRAIEEIGKYHPTEEPSLIDIDSERAQYWLGVGAQPTEQVRALLKVTGDWAKHTGEGDPEGTLRVREPRPDKRALYEAALAAADGSGDSSAPASRKTRKSEEPKKSEDAKASKPERASKPEKAEEPEAAQPEEAKVEESAEAAQPEETKADEPEAQKPAQSEPAADTADSTEA